MVRTNVGSPRTAIRTGVIHQFDLVAITDVPTRADELFVDQDSRLFFGFEIGHHFP
jgi:hypothetical protein